MQPITLLERELLQIEQDAVGSEWARLLLAIHLLDQINAELEAAQRTLDAMAELTR